MQIIWKTVLLTFLIPVIFIDFGWCKHGETSPGFFAYSITGERFVSKKAKLPYVISFFYSECRPCYKETPALYKLMSQTFPQFQLLFIDPNPKKEDSVEKIKAFASCVKVPEKYFYFDPLGRLMKKFYQKKMVFPTILGIYKNKYLFEFKGYEEKNITEIEKILNKYK